MTSNRGDAFIVRSTIDLAHNLACRSSPRASRTRQTMDELAELGCNVAQGFHLSRPLPPQDFTTWLASSGTSPPSPRRSLGCYAPDLRWQYS